MMTSTGKVKQKQKINSHNELLQTQMLVDMGPLYCCDDVGKSCTRAIEIQSKDSEGLHEKIF